jgi:hypothetical protein
LLAINYHVPFLIHYTKGMLITNQKLNNVTIELIKVLDQHFSCEDLKVFLKYDENKELKSYWFEVENETYFGTDKVPSEQEETADACYLIPEDVFVYNSEELVKAMMNNETQAGIERHCLAEFDNMQHSINHIEGEDWDKNIIDLDDDIVINVNYGEMWYMFSEELDHYDELENIARLEYKYYDNLDHDNH